MSSEQNISLYSSSCTNLISVGLASNRCVFNELGLAIVCVTKSVNWFLQPGVFVHSTTVPHCLFGYRNTTPSNHRRWSDFFMALSKALDNCNLMVPASKFRYMLSSRHEQPKLFALGSLAISCLCQPTLPFATSCRKRIDQFQRILLRSNGHETSEHRFGDSRFTVERIEYSTASVNQVCEISPKTTPETSWWCW